MKSAFAFTLIAAAVLSSPQLKAQPLYYDTNGATPGTATSSTQNFTDAVWTTDPMGATPTTGYTPNSSVIFSAGANGTGTQNVTVTDTEAVNGFTFNNGTVTLLGSGSPNLSIGAGGIANNSTDGATTFANSLGTVTATADQSWNNNSTQALNINSNVTSAGSTLSFSGTGSGKVNLNGNLNGSLNLNATSPTSTVYLNSESNGFVGTITVNGGGLVFQNQGSLNNNNITLENGGVLESANEVFSTGNDLLSNNITLGVGGGKVAAGVVGAYGNDTIFSGTFTGGTGLSIVDGDFITANDGTSNVGTLTVTGSRLLVGSAGIFGNNAIVNVNSVLDFGWNNVSLTLNNVINMADGSALETRGGPVATVLNDVVLPTTGTVTLGSDDVGYGSISINNNQALGGALTLVLNGTNGGTPVYLNGVVSGAGSLTVNASGNGSTPLFLAGNNNYTGPTTLNGVTVYPEGNGFGSSTVTLNNSTINLTGGSLANHFVVGGGYAGVFSLVNNNAQSLTGTIDVTDSNAYLGFTNSGSANLTIGNINEDYFVGGNDRGIGLDDYGTGTIILNGIYTSPPGGTGQSGTNGGIHPSTFLLGANAPDSGRYEVGPNADFSNFEPFNVNGKAAIWMFSGTLILDNSTFVNGQYIALTSGRANVNEAVLIDGAQTINASIYTGNNTQFTVGQNTADSSTWNGTISGDSYDYTDNQGNDIFYPQVVTFSAVAGGTLTIAGDINSSYSALNKTGAGTVILNRGNDYTLVKTNVAFDIQQGTVLIHNTDAATTPFGNNRGTVNVEAGATLGGTGYIGGAYVQRVIAMDATSQITAGDPGNAVGTLTLGGGLSTNKGSNEGLTLNFTLDSLDEVTQIDLGSGTLNIGGLITVNIATTDGAIDTLQAYELMYGTGSWIGSNVTTNNTTFVFNTPAGYAVDSYDFDTVGRKFDVTFVATPEPSTYALLGIGALLLVGATALRRRLS